MRVPATRAALSDNPTMNLNERRAGVPLHITDSAVGAEPGRITAAAGGRGPLMRVGEVA